MRVLFAIVVLMSSFAASQQPRGLVTSVAVQHDVSAGSVRFIVRGKNPCSAVRLNYGDGTTATHSTSDLPFSFTYEYSRVGTFTVGAEGVGNCDGVASNRIKVSAVRPRPVPPLPSDPTTPQATGNMRFAGMDRNGDRVITRGEWTGSARSFTVHDWNRDGVLSGNEVQPGAQTGAQTGHYINWSEAQFRQLDLNRDNRITVQEWPYQREDFLRIDRNRDNIVVLNEYQIGAIDDDRGDRFDDLDVNRDNRITPREWHGSLDAFRWLDRNDDGVLSRAEAVGTGTVTGQGKGVELADAAVLVSSRVAWTDTGINVAAGDYLSIQASGEIQYSPVARDIAQASGVAGKPATAKAPLPQSNIGALIGRIGTDTAPFFVGDSMAPKRAARSGRLYLRVNDDLLNDNRGQFQASITVTRGSER